MFNTVKYDTQNLTDAQEQFVKTIVQKCTSKQDIELVEAVRHEEDSQVDVWINYEEAQSLAINIGTLNCTWAQSEENGTLMLDIKHHGITYEVFMAY